MAGETKYISRYTGAQIDEALGLLFAGESTRDAAYQAAEAERDTQFESKEATRDEANRAALDAAEAIAELQRQARGRVTDIDSLHNVADIGTYHYIGNGWKGLVNVNFDASSKVSQVALSSSTPSYENDSLTWLSGKPCVMVRTYTNGAWSAWSKAGTDVVNDLVTGGTDKALSAEQGKVLDQKVSALGRKIEGSVKNYKDGQQYNYTQNPRGSVGASKYHCREEEYIPVTGGDVIVWHHGIDSTGALGMAQYDADKNLTGCYLRRNNAVDRTITLAADTTIAFVRASFMLAEIADCFVSVNGVKVWQPAEDYTGHEQRIAALEAVTPLTESDVVNDLTTGGTGKALSAEQGKVLKEGLDEVKTRKDEHSLQTLSAGSYFSSRFEFVKGRTYTITIASGEVSTADKPVLSKSLSNIDNKQTFTYGKPFTPNDDGYIGIYQAGIASASRPFAWLVVEDVPRIADIEQRLGAVEEPMPKIELAVVENGWEGVEEYAWEDYYNGGEWVAGTIQPNGVIATSATARTSPYIKTGGARITLPSVTITANDVTYTLRYRVVAMLDTKRTGATMLLDRDVTTKTVNTSGYKYARVTAYLYNGSTIATADEYAILEGRQTPITITMDRVVLTGTFMPELEERVAALESGSGTKTDVVSQHDPTTTLLKFQQWRKRIADSSHVDTGKKRLVLLQFSDVHGSKTNIERIVEYYNAYAAYIDDVLHCGDTTPGEWSQSDAYWKGVSGAERILNCIGNHDTAYRDATTGYDWTAHVGSDAFGKFFVPYISNWGVVHDGDTSHCYYYKDYAAMSVRLIVLDAMSIAKDGDAAQIAWFAQVLADARTQGLHVVGAYHYATITDTVQCAFTVTQPPSLPSDMPQSVLGCVDQFVEDGGTFACWLAGHRHRDFFGTCTGATYGHKIATLVVSCASGDVNQCDGDDIARPSGTRGYDLFNMVCIDAHKGRLSVFRVGSDFDNAMRHIGCMSYDYINHRLLASW